MCKIIGIIFCFSFPFAANLCAKATQGDTEEAPVENPKVIANSQKNPNKPDVPNKTDIVNSPQQIETESIEGCLLNLGATCYMNAVLQTIARLSLDTKGIMFNDGSELSKLGKEICENLRANKKTTRKLTLDFFNELQKVSADPKTIGQSNDSICVWNDLATKFNWFFTTHKVYPCDASVVLTPSKQKYLWTVGLCTGGDDIKSFIEKYCNNIKNNIPAHKKCPRCPAISSCILEVFDPKLELLVIKYEGPEIGMPLKNVIIKKELFLKGVTNNEYVLQAIIEYPKGHVYSDIKVGTKWMRYDDNSVKEVTEAEVETAAKKQGYILFYTKK